MKSPSELEPGELGRWGETIAAGYLKSKGYRIRERNYRCPRGELDIVAERDGTLVFVEVKTRRGTRMGEPVEAVSPRKVEKLRELAGYYLAEKTGGMSEIRLDVISVLLREGADDPEVTHVVAVC